jgi:hypothetical protein
MNSSPNYDKILNYAKEIQNKYKKFQNKTEYTTLTIDEFKNEMSKEYKELHDSFNSIFNKAVSGNLDIIVFTYMIEKAKAIQKNKISNSDASKQVGQKILETFGKPNIDKNDNPN